MDEFDRCVSLLESSRTRVLGFTAAACPASGVRRLVMRRTKPHVYDLHDEPNAVVDIVAVWGAPKTGVPDAEVNTAAMRPPRAGARARARLEWPHLGRESGSVVAMQVVAPGLSHLSTSLTWCARRNDTFPCGSSAVDRCWSPRDAIAVPRPAKDQAHEHKAREGAPPPRDDDERAVPAGPALLFRPRPSPGDPQAQGAAVHGRGQRASDAGNGCSTPRPRRCDSLPAAMTMCQRRSGRLSSGASASRRTGP